MLCVGRVEGEKNSSESLCIWTSFFQAAAAAAAKLLQSCPTPCDPIDSCPTGSPVPGILQARVLEWGAISFSSFRLVSFKPKSQEFAMLVSQVTQGSIFPLPNPQ